MTTVYGAKFIRRPDTWLWDMLGGSYDIPMDWFRCRFHFLKVALEERKFRRDAAIVPQLGERSKLASVEISGGRDVKYVIVYAREVPENWQPGIQETLVYRRDVAGTDLVYDLTGEFMQGKARPFECDLRKLPLRIYAVLPFQVERIELAAEQRPDIKLIHNEGHDAYRVSLNLRVTIQDATGSPIAGRFLIYLGLRRRKPIWERGGFAVTNQQRLPERLVSLAESTMGDWSLVARLLLTGEELSLPLNLAAAADKTTVGDAPLTSDGLSVRRAPQPVQLDHN